MLTVTLVVSLLGVVLLGILFATLLVMATRIHNTQLAAYNAAQAMVPQPNPMPPNPTAVSLWAYGRSWGKWFIGALALVVGMIIVPWVVLGSASVIGSVNFGWKAGLTLVITLAVLGLLGWRAYVFSQGPRAGTGPTPAPTGTARPRLSSYPNLSRWLKIFWGVFVIGIILTALVCFMDPRMWSWLLQFSHLYPLLALYAGLGAIAAGIASNSLAMTSQEKATSIASLAAGGILTAFAVIFFSARLLAYVGAQSSGAGFFGPEVAGAMGLLSALLMLACFYFFIRIFWVKEKTKSLITALACGFFGILLAFIGGHGDDVSRKTGMNQSSSYTTPSPTHPSHEKTPVTSKSIRNAVWANEPDLVLELNEDPEVPTPGWIRMRGPMSIATRNGEPFFVEVSNCVNLPEENAVGVRVLFTRNSTPHVNGRWMRFYRNPDSEVDDVGIKWKYARDIELPLSTTKPSKEAEWH